MGEMTWELFFAVLGGVAVIVAGIVGAIRWVVGALNSIRKELNEFQVKVAEQYATRAVVQKMEDRLADQIRQLREDLNSHNSTVLEELRKIASGG